MLTKTTKISQKFKPRKLSEKSKFKNLLNYRFYAGRAL